jgi:hypothetical protein
MLYDSLQQATVIMQAATPPELELVVTQQEHNGFEYLSSQPYMGYN